MSTGEYKALACYADGQLQIYKSIEVWCYSRRGDTSFGRDNWENYQRRQSEAMSKSDSNEWPFSCDYDSDENFNGEAISLPFTRYKDVRESTIVEQTGTNLPPFQMSLPCTLEEMPCFQNRMRRIRRRYDGSNSVTYRNTSPLQALWNSDENDAQHSFFGMYAGGKFQDTTRTSENKHYEWKRTKGNNFVIKSRDNKKPKRKGLERFNPYTSKTAFGPLPKVEHGSNRFSLESGFSQENENLVKEFCVEFQIMLEDSDSKGFDVENLEMEGTSGQAKSSVGEV